MTPEKIHSSRFELLMDAGNGAQKAGDILITALAHTGRFVYIEPMIPAEISPPKRTKPALSGSIVRLADFDLKNIGNTTDIIVAQHEIVLDRRLDDQEHEKDIQILLDMGDEKNNQASYGAVLNRCEEEGLKVTPFHIVDEARELIKSLVGRGSNMYYIGLISAIYTIPKECVIKEIEATFGKKLKPEILEKNVKLFDLGYEYSAMNISFKYTLEGSSANDGEKKILIDGNSALSAGIINAGFKLLSGYPITPASSIMHTLAKEFPKHGGMVHQAEDEIAAIGAAIGSYFGGVPAITATSGPGISLKQEFIGYAQVSEIPIVIADIQRGGPSTGLPTKTEQSDLPSVIFGCHGDHTKIVISIGNQLDCYLAPMIARYLTEKLKLPVFIMSDFQMANSYKVIPKPKEYNIENVDDIPDEVFDHFWLDRLPDDIEMVRTNQAVPGTPGGMRRVTGLNTDETGKVNYFAGTNQRSHAVRNEKVHVLQRALREPEMFGKYKEGDLLIVGWGSTRGALSEAIHRCQDQGLSVTGMCFRIVYPMPLILHDIFKRFKKVATVEGAFGDHIKRPPLAMFLRSKTLKDIKPIVSRATGRPITPGFIEKQIKATLKEMS
jgi:2-oxoglutarate ferredoxin oxidoreductase subunit alpha